MQVQTDLGPISLIGRAYGNRVVRHFATKYPRETESVILRAAGEAHKVDPDINQHLKKAFNPFTL